MTVTCKTSPDFFLALYSILVYKKINVKNSKLKDRVKKCCSIKGNPVRGQGGQKHGWV
jgi:hypothetical protein